MRAELSTVGTASRIEGPLLFLRRNVRASLSEAVEVTGEDGRQRLGRIVSLDEEHMVVELLESTAGLSLATTRVRFHGRPLSFPVGPDILGRVLDGVGRPIDGGPPIAARNELRIDGLPLNPAARADPQDFIETGLSSIDLLNSMVRGQKLPIFSVSGLPHDRMATRIVQRARLRDETAGRFAIVFAGIGIPHDTAETFRRAMQATGALRHTAMFLNLASESSSQRLLTPRFALTAAEYLAFEQDMHVLVVMTDMTNYCEALREVSASRGEVPARKGYPGYLYSDLATLYERAGILQNRKGSLTQLPILTMPAGDISHPVPDLSGYITEGQIVLDRDLDRRGIEPPVDVLPSLSRLMKDGIGEGYTDPDHPALAQQLYAAYARADSVRRLASVVGAEGLPVLDRKFLRFGDEFEGRLVHQSEARTLEESMDLAWRLLRELPHSVLDRLSDAQIERHLGEDARAEADEQTEDGQAEEEPSEQVEGPQAEEDR
ncbi:MAG: V-type ATP synthase subunit B [Myxococcota bacterium]